MLIPYQPFIPKTLTELRDMLNGMMLISPRFEDLTGYFPGRNIDNTFYELNEGLRFMAPKLGEELYSQLKERSDQMRAHFEADPEDKTDDSLKGRAIILEMIDLLKQNRGKC